MFKGEITEWLWGHLPFGSFSLATPEREGGTRLPFKNGAGSKVLCSIPPTLFSFVNAFVSPACWNPLGQLNKEKETEEKGRVWGWTGSSAIAVMPTEMYRRDWFLFFKWGRCGLVRGEPSKWCVCECPIPASPLAAATATHIFIPVSKHLVYGCVLYQCSFLGCIYSLALLTGRHNWFCTGWKVLGCMLSR